MGGGPPPSRSSLARSTLYSCASGVRVGGAKISDDYRAKVRLWARDPKVVPLPPMPPLPRFASRKFRTHEEMNQRKQSLLREVARLRPVARHG